MYLCIDKVFDGIDQVGILNIDAASGIPKAPPQKHKENHCFLKGPLKGSSGTPRPTSHRRGSRAGSCCGIVHFRKVFKGVRPIDKVLVVLIRSALLGDMHETHDFPLFLEVPRGSLCACVECTILLSICCQK